MTLSHSGTDHTFSSVMSIQVITTREKFMRLVLIQIQEKMKSVRWCALCNSDVLAERKLEVPGNIERRRTKNCVRLRKQLRGEKELTKVVVLCCKRMVLCPQRSFCGSWRQY
eukprot:g46605.t1